MGECRLSILGDWRLCVDETDILVRGRKNRALCTFLLFEQGRVQSREKLTHILWGASEEARGRASLRTGLSNLRASFGAVGLQINENPHAGISLCSGSTAIDARDRVTDIAATLAPTQLHDVALALASCLEDHRGLSPWFDDWISQTRVKLINDALSALKTRYTNASELNETRLLAGKAALVLDPLCEDAVRAIMHCETSAGRAARALKFYDEFYARITEELDAEPSLTTQDLAVDIKMGRLETECAPITRRAQPTAPATPTEPDATIAVLPFEAMGPVEIPRYVRLGILDRITTLLSALPSPQVISSNSTRQFLTETPGPKELREILGVDYCLVGSILALGESTTVAAQLVETREERVIWAANLEYALEDFLQLKVPLAQHIAKAVAPNIDLQLLKESHRIAEEQLGAHQLVLRARDLLFELGQNSFQRAGSFLQKAVESEPYFALGHLRLAEWHSLALWEGRAHGASRTALEYHAKRAFQLRPGDGRALAFWAHTRFMFAREHDIAIEFVEQALNAAPNDAEALANCIVALAHGGRAEQAVSVADRALSLSPLDPWLFRTQHFASIAYYARGDFRSAASLGLSAFKQAPNYLSNVRATIAALVADERLGDAEPLVTHHNAMEPGFSVEAFVPRHGFRHEKDRRLYGDRLLRAGLSR